jgi:hypothetical protein
MTPGSSGDPRLLVFLHVAAKQRAFQTELQAALPGIVVTAVGRTGDFDRALGEGQDAVLTLPVVLAAHGLTPILRGVRQGSADEKYSLVGTQAPPDPGKVTTVGALDLLGRDGMAGFVQSLVGAHPKVERVTKVEDLLPLLQMQRVEAILLASRLLPEVKMASRLNLSSRELPAAVGLPTVAKLAAPGAQVLSAIKRLPNGITRAFGVEEWR